MNSKIRFKLTPMGAFFFGGERSFSISKKGKNGKYKDDVDKWSSYIVESNPFPQQTSILGMLRFLLLRNDSEAFSGNKIVDSNKAQTLIGAHGFTVNANNQENTYGVIKKISYCYIENAKGEILLPVSLDAGLKIDFSNAVAANFNGKEMLIPEIKCDVKNQETGKVTEEVFSGKSNRITGFINLNTEEVVAFDTVYAEDARIGINRNIKTGLTEDSALFKQVSYKLKEGYSFGFCAEFAEEFAAGKTELVELGGDSSKFALTSVATDAEMPVMPIAAVDKPKVVLLSDTCIAADKLNYAYAISESEPFTFLKSNVKDTQVYHRIPNERKDTTKNESNYLHRSERYSLYKRGSVFFFKEDGDATAFTDLIDSKKEFIQIGYNNYKLISNK